MAENKKTPSEGTDKAAKDAENAVDDVKDGAKEGAKAVVRAAAQFAKGNWVGSAVTVALNAKNILKLVFLLIVVPVLLIVILVCAPLSLFLNSDEAYMDEEAYEQNYIDTIERTEQIVKSGFEDYLPEAYERGQEVKDSYGDKGEEIEIIVNPDSSDSITLTQNAANEMMAIYHVIEYFYDADIDDTEGYGEEYFRKVEEAVHSNDGDYPFFYVASITSDIEDYEYVIQEEAVIQEERVIQEEVTETVTIEEVVGQRFLRWDIDERGRRTPIYEDIIETRTETRVVQPEIRQPEIIQPEITETRYRGTVTVELGMHSDYFMREELNALITEQGGVPRYVSSGHGSGSWPLPVQYDESYISSGYGYRDIGDGRGTLFHDGVDFAVPEGTEVYAIMEGTVWQVNHADYNTYYEGGDTSCTGNCVYLEHEGSIYSVYMHLSGIAAGITEGTHVTQGQCIGYVGNTGYSTGAHLDLTVRVGSVGNCVNPMDYINHEESAQSASAVTYTYPDGTTNAFGFVREQELYPQATGLQSSMYSAVSLDSEGFAVSRGRYVVSMAFAFGSPGDAIEITLENGQVIHAVIGLNTAARNLYDSYGYKTDAGQYVLADFWTDSATWYSQSTSGFRTIYTQNHPCPGTSRCHPEWDSKTVRIENITAETIFEMRDYTGGTSGSVSVTNDIMQMITDVKNNLALEFGGVTYTSTGQVQTAAQWNSITNTSRQNTINSLNAAGYTDTQIVIIIGWLQGEADYSDDPYLGYCSANCIMNQVDGGLSFADGPLWRQQYYSESAMRNRTYAAAWKESTAKSVELALANRNRSITQCWGIESAGVSRTECFYVSDVILSEGEPTGVW